MNDLISTVPEYKKKDFASDQEVRWCPGCGDYTILSSLQIALTKAGKKKEDIVCVSGIGCSSRFPYYMGTYGYHTIHGRAPAIASGIKCANPDLSVWIITGDGDGLSIGGNHMIHALRRNLDMNILLFNNEIYGLTKGQYSPTTKQGKVTKSSPHGSIDHTFNTGKLAIGSGATFIAKSIDTDPKHMSEMMLKADQHKGISFLELYQNCVIFNDKVHDEYTNRQTRDDNYLYLEHGQPMIFGKEKSNGIMLKGFELIVVDVGEGCTSLNDILVHDKYNEILAYQLLNYSNPPHFPMAIGEIFEKNATSYDDDLVKQINDVTAKRGPGKFNDLLHSGETWKVV
ncbi:MAG: 2-oxoacid:ferredoxin oxidoreductase subunit beta [Bacteriovorax sp.]|nr:2-oxoacid:ferredoxin oxidoreductase subunit beta [Bacteriovorax sp.]